MDDGVAGAPFWVSTLSSVIRQPRMLLPFLLHWEGWACAVQSTLACQPIRPGQIRLPEIHQRHPEVTNRIVVALDGVNHTPVLSAVRSASRQLIGVEDLTLPRGVLCPWPFARPCGNLTISNLEQPDTDGSVTGRTGAPREADHAQIGGQ